MDNNVVIKPKIKINFSDFWNSFNKDNNLFTIILRKYLDVEISDKPDFLICSNRYDNGIPFTYTNYDCVRICVMGENISPNFTSFDYVIGFDHLSFSDRYFRLPFGFYFDDARPWVPETISYEQAKRILENKKHFCNFIYGHQSSHGMREKLFRELDKYKRVVSPGRYLNNIGGGGCCWAEKHQYVQDSKFTIACDSIHYPGFVTEKIVDAFRWHSIPIYFGEPDVDIDFNPASFIHCKSESDIDNVLSIVEEIDQDDEKYIEMLMQCPLHGYDYLSERYKELEEFLVHIFIQPPEVAGRRVKYYCADTYENALKKYNKIANKFKLLHKYDIL